MLHVPNIKALRLPISEKKIFKDFCHSFPFGSHGNQSLVWNPMFWTTLVKPQTINIPAKFHQDWPSGLGYVQRNCGRRTIDDRHFVLRWANKAIFSESNSHVFSNCYRFTPGNMVAMLEKDQSLPLPCWTETMGMNPKVRTMGWAELWFKPHSSVNPIVSVQHCLSKEWSFSCQDSRNDSFDWLVGTFGFLWSVC